MSESKGENVFKKFNRYPYEHQCNHALKLVKLYNEKEPKHYGSCYEHISSPPDDLECAQLGDRLERFWLMELNSKGPEKASLTKVMFRCLRSDYIKLLLWSMMVRLLFAVMILESLRRLLMSIDEFNVVQKELDQLNSGEAISNDTNYDLAAATDGEEIYQNMQINVLLLFLSTTAFFTLYSNMKLRQCRCGLKCRTAMIQLIHRKSTRLHLLTSIQESSSRALSLISNEVSFIEEAHKYLVYIIVGPLALALASVWLAVTQVGWQPVALTLPVLLIVISIEIYLPKLYKRISRRRKEETNKRIDTMSNFLSSIKVVKMYAWELKFKERVDELRQSELKQLKLLDMFNLSDASCVAISARIVTSIIAFGYMYVFGKLDTKILFTSTLAYNFFRIDGFYYFPKSVKSLSDILVACKNIKQYLLLEETQDDRTICECDNPALMRTNGLHYRNSSGFARIVAENLTVSYGTSDKTVIDGLTMSLESGDLSLVIGPVGSGKSTLLLSLLGELNLARGSLSVSRNARIAYASQEPCLFSDSFRNNILNGRTMDLERYKEVIHACSLVRDINLLPSGDETLVGPKGVSLSGGQKARLSLARSIYSRADIYLLDDPLSAVDSKVAKDIFSRCICKFLANKLVVLATHQLQFLDQSNKIVMLRRNERPIFGSTNELLKRQELLSLLSLYQESGAGSAPPNEDATREKTTVKPASEDDKNESKLENFRSLMSKQSGGKRESCSAYSYLFQVSFSRFGLAVFVVLALVSTVSSGTYDYYFRYWSNQVALLETMERAEPESETIPMPSGIERIDEQLISYWILFNLIILIAGAANFLFQLELTRALRRASDVLHDQMVESLFRARLSFYDFCPMGELSSRYAGDFAIVDHALLPIALIVAFATTFILGGIVPVALINPVQLIPYLGMFLIIYPIAAANYKKLKVLMELSKTMRSPMYTNLASTIEELSTIRSERDHLISAKAKFDLSLNKLTSMSLLAFVYETYLTTIIKSVSMSAIGIMFYIMFGVFWRQLDLSTAGTFLLVAISVAGSYPGLMEYGSQLETAMVSVNNVRKYIGLEPEPEEAQPSKATGDALPLVDMKPLAPANRGPIEWPFGQISFEKVTLRYFEDERPAVEELTFQVRGGERVGVVGRTGAGKSSIVSLLYRLYPFEGSIKIDGVDTKSLPLTELRASIGVIPQEPVLFCDTLRKNLDPFSAYSDAEIWNALEVVNLRQFTAQNLSSGLEHLISEGGRNFSAGQRQLVCLARAVLRLPKVLLIDEATANVDSDTDSLIQKTIRSEFTNSTIITIAHRLNTILDYDRILVLDAGRIVEFDRVDRLLELENGVFKSMLKSCSNQDLIT